MEQQTFDFIIAGGGTAGCVLARRLSDSLPHLSFLLLEAGPKSHPLIEVPLAYVPGAGADWVRQTVPQKGAGGLTVDAMSGRVLGGSTAVNFNAWTRGPAIDFDEWGDLVGDERWSWAGQLPYFKKSETVHPGRNPLDPELHGDSGPVQLTEEMTRSCNPELDDLSERVWKSMGLNRVADENGGYPLGYSAHWTSVYEGKRQYAAEAYKPWANGNVTIVTDALVSRVVIEDGRATGVQATLSSIDSPTVFKARKEVLVCSGASGSAKLLLLSGIGPKQELSRHGITQRVDSPVGENLSDHALVTTHWKLPEKFSVEGKGTVTRSAWFAFFHNNPDLLHAAGQHLDGDDLERYQVPEKIHMQALMMYGHWPFRDFSIPPPEKCSQVAIFNILVTPTARGTVTLRSSDPTDDPVIDPNLLGNDVDRASMQELVMRTKKHMESEVGEGVHAQEYLVDDEFVNDTSERGFEARIKNTMMTVYHPSGTCAMGKVVDSSCKLYGIEGLRVVDASVFPIPIACNYQAIVYAVAEQAAVIIASSV